MDHFCESLGGHCTYRQLYRWAARRVPPVGARCVEVGVLYGQGVAFLAVELINRGCVDARIDMVDSAPWGAKTLASLRPAGDIIGAYHQELSWDGARHYEDGSLDLVFIDASHAYVDVAKDIDAWARKVREGGYLAGHDYCAELPGVQQAVTERFDRVEVFRGEPFTNGKYYPAWVARMDGCGNALGADSP